MLLINVNCKIEIRGDTNKSIISGVVIIQMEVNPCAKVIFYNNSFISMFRALLILNKVIKLVFISPLSIRPT